MRHGFGADLGPVLALGAVVPAESLPKPQRGQRVNELRSELDLTCLCWLRATRQKADNFIWRLKLELLKHNEYTRCDKPQPPRTRTRLTSRFVCNICEQVLRRKARPHTLRASPQRSGRIRVEASRYRARSHVLRRRLFGGRAHACGPDTAPSHSRASPQRPSAKRDRGEAKRGPDDTICKLSRNAASTLHPSPPFALQCNWCDKCTGPTKRVQSQKLAQHQNAGACSRYATTSRLI